MISLQGCGCGLVLLAVLGCSSAAQPTGKYQFLDRSTAVVEHGANPVTQAMDEYAADNPNLLETGAWANGKSREISKGGLTTMYEVCLQGRIPLEIVSVTFGVSVTLTLTSDSMTLAGMIGLGMRIGDGWLSFSVSVEGTVGFEVKLPSCDPSDPGGKDTVACALSTKTKLVFFAIEQFAREKMKGSMLGSIIFGQPNPDKYANQLYKYLLKWDTNYGRGTHENVHRAFEDMIYNYYSVTTEAVIHRMAKGAGAYWTNFYSNWKAIVFSYQKLGNTTGITGGGTCSCSTCSGHGNTYRMLLMLPSNPEGNSDEHGTHHSGSTKFKKHRLKDYETIWELFTVKYLTTRLFGIEQLYNYYGESYSAVSCADVISVQGWNQQYPASTYRIQPTTSLGMQTAQGYLCMALQGGILDTKPANEDDWCGGTKNQYRNVRRTLKLLFPELYPPAGTDWKDRLRWYNAMLFNTDPGGTLGPNPRFTVMEPAIAARKNALNKGVFTTFMHMGALLSGTPLQVAERVVHYYEKQEATADPCTGACTCGITKVWVGISATVSAGKGTSYCAFQSFEVTGAIQWTWTRTLSGGQDGKKCLLKELKGPLVTVSVILNIGLGSFTLNLMASWSPAQDMMGPCQGVNSAKMCSCHELYREVSSRGLGTLTSVKKAPQCKGLSDNEITTGDITGSNWGITAEIQLGVSNDDVDKLNKFMADADKNPTLLAFEDDMATDLTTMLSTFTEDIIGADAKSKHDTSHAFGTLLKGVKSTFIGLMESVAKNGLTEAGKSLLNVGTSDASNFMDDAATSIANTVMKSLPGIPAGTSDGVPVQSVLVGVIIAVDVNTVSMIVNLNIALNYWNQEKMKIGFSGVGSIAAYYINSQTVTVCNYNFHTESGKLTKKGMAGASFQSVHGDDDFTTQAAVKHTTKRAHRRVRRSRGRKRGHRTLNVTDSGAVGGVGAASHILTDESGNTLPSSFTLSGATQHQLNQEYSNHKEMKLGSRPVYISADGEWAIHHDTTSLGWSIIAAAELHLAKPNLVLENEIKNKIKAAKAAGNSTIDAPDTKFPKMLVKTEDVTGWEKLFGQSTPWFGQTESPPPGLFEWNADFEVWDRNVDMKIHKIVWP